MKFRVMCIALVLFCLQFTGKSTAQTPSTPPPLLATSSAFSFRAAEGSNLTLYVRRSLQLRIAQNNILLSNNKLIYCETSIVKSLGSYELGIDQYIAIPYSTLDSCLESSKNIDSATEERWGEYANNVQFDLSYLQPLSGTVATQDESNAQTATPYIAPTPLASSSLIGKTDKRKNITLPPLVWIVFGGVIGVLAYRKTEKK